MSKENFFKKQYEVLSSQEITRYSQALSFFDTAAEEINVPKLIRVLAEKSGMSALGKAVDLLDESPQSLESFMGFIKKLVDENFASGLRKEIGLGRILKFLQNHPKLPSIVLSAARVGGSVYVEVITNYLIIGSQLTGCYDDFKDLANCVLQPLPPESTYKLKLNEFFLASSAEGRHDNDFPDKFRKIRVMPTIAELNADSDLKDVCIAALKRDDTSYGLIEKQFRLLREDMMGPIRNDLEDVDSKKTVFSSPFPYGVDGFDHRSKKCSVKIAFTPSPQLEARLNKFKEEDRTKLTDFIENDIPRVLSVDSLLLFVNCRIGKNESYREDNVHSEPKTGITVCFVGKIVKRKAEDIADLWFTQRKLTASVEFSTDSMNIVLQSLANLERPRENCYLSENVIQSNVSLFNYLPVLERLKAIDDLPMESELINYQRVLSPSTPNSYVRKIMDEDICNIDPVILAQYQRLTLIQGPPGTGKTFVGVQIIRALLKIPGTKILIISYTHHALDNLLKRLITKDEVGALDESVKAEIVRFGNPNKVSKELEDCCFREDYDINFSRDDLYNKINLKETIESLASTVEEMALDVTSKQMFTSGSWRDVAKVLTANETGQFMSDPEIFKKWLLNRRRPDKLGDINLNDAPDLWSLSPEERKEKTQSWWLKWANLSTFLEKTEELNRCKKELYSLKKVYSIDKVKNKKILACTTTFAAINRDIIDSCSPTVILVEEAGEIHESQILTNLTRTIQHLIMIGDHKQLKPKLENYKLRSESDYGINFDVSLFERLVKNGYPFKVLNKQHRMIPQIREFLMSTYPQLEDDKNDVLGRANICGSPSNILFINHSEPEDGKNVNNVEIGLPDSSKTNAFEASLAVKLVEYLIQNGHKSDEMVILTPYLSQSILIRNLVKKSMHLEPKLTESDRYELLEYQFYCPDSDGEDYYDNGYGGGVPFYSQNGRSPVSNSMKKKSSYKNNKISPQKSSKNKSSIRVATIDNFQGEESKIIIVSLVRSNPRANIGFMKVPERVNVLMSRARDGLFMIGNAQTYSTSHRGKFIWKPIIQRFFDQNAFLTFSQDPKEFNIQRLLFPPTKLWNSDVEKCSGTVSTSLINNVEIMNISEPAEKKISLLLETGAEIPNSCDVPLPSPLSLGCKYHVFLAHAWKKDELGRDNHSRVVSVKEALQSRGIVTWIDSDNMKMKLRDCMSAGLCSSMAIIFFVTRKYEEKINSGNTRDDCHYELSAAMDDERLAKNRIVVVMEECMKNSNDWKQGRLRHEIGRELYVDISTDELIEPGADTILSRLKEM